MIPFQTISTSLYPSAGDRNLRNIGHLFGCACQGSCLDNIDSCSCIQSKGLSYHDDGRLDLLKKQPLFECNALCNCNDKCVNRISQQGSKYAIQIIDDGEKGKAVEACESIPAGAFISEYIGEILSRDQAESRHRLNRPQNYLLNIAEKIPTAFVENLICQNLHAVEYTTWEVHIDATYHGNISRYFNHSCEPNMITKVIYIDRMTPGHIGFFAASDISPGERLEYSYGSVTEQSGTRCRCRKPSCRQWLPYGQDLA
uniref:SET domain-containing protein n=1 Tax=Spongospora subterranea TaxID=70186 RepID=A0A0H5RBT6_9EUKA|eukprot:CRZ11695.1 hypothetical protein [Spongospora subterranea]